MAPGRQPPDHALDLKALLPPGLSLAGRGLVIEMVVNILTVNDAVMVHGQRLLDLRERPCWCVESLMIRAVKARRFSLLFVKMLVR